jgi:hypothetical protein
MLVYQGVNVAASSQNTACKQSSYDTRSAMRGHP